MPWSKWALTTKAKSTLVGVTPEMMQQVTDAAYDDMVGQLTAAGFTVVKLKLPSYVDEGLERLRAVRAAAPGVRVRGDANGTWDEPTARAALPQLVALGLGLV